MEIKNTVLAFVLIMTIYTAYLLFFPHPQPVPPPAENTEARVEEKAPVAVPSVPVATPARLSPEDEFVPESGQSTLLKKEIVVENDLFWMTLTNAGGRIKTMRLKGFRQGIDDDPDSLVLVDAARDDMATLATQGEGVWAFSPDTMFHASESKNAVSISGNDTYKLVFKAVSGANIIEKTYTFTGNRYFFDVSLRIINRGGQIARGNVTLSLVQPVEQLVSKDRFAFSQAAALVDDDLKTSEFAKLSKTPFSFLNKVKWSGFEDKNKYFIGTVIPLSGGTRSADVIQTEDAYFNRIASESFNIGPGEEAALTYTVYYGPRDMDILKTSGHELDRIIDFGWFDIIARPLLKILHFFYGFVGNYGWSIILLTVIIKILFWPLTEKSYTSMKAMQKLQPEMQKIRQKFKDDKQQLNIEVMQLYRKHKVNPLGGCLPMLLQIPVFFALYKVLMEDIALRHAPFMLWIQDLSAKDPYYVTPLIMGASMFIQQKMTPNTMEGPQAKMLLYMPLIFTFMFLNFPSGLVIYWLVNNLLTILQQFLINRKSAAANA
ncbi:MAG: membrane protein insertase YidC [Deltaproteobacteria bacterium]|nr:membrane protein insertase YidC [Deltaproteobacteria bacterium]